ncbi:polyadenylate-binding protein 1A-like [Hemibagrus wyckioides]|uniref:polyadenylate-binding protein 1A-like n=1 Tax=Hemibagrus wyckioides TaxID=337641 RepID=UPI00266D089C|nr:polyadenylate-binding protein 1A-like [Hemibagrus wyckioides]
MAALFVKDLHPEVSEVILSNRFRPAGHVQSVHICRDRKTGSPLGYAYVNFRYRDDAERAIDMFSFELLLGRPMRVMWSNWEPTAKPIKGGNIFIRNLDWSIDCTSLFDTFSVFGRIVSCKVVESKGYRYVQYESAEAAERLNGKLLNDRQVKCLRRAPPLLYNVPPKLRQPVLPPWFKRSTLETPCTKDTVQSTKASASEDISQIVYTAASQMVQAAGSPAPVNNVEAVETAGPENSEESVETAASEGSVEAVKTVASDDRVEAVEATAPVEATETAAPEETLEAMITCFHW